MHDFYPFIWSWMFPVVLVHVSAENKAYTCLWIVIPLSYKAFFGILLVNPWSMSKKLYRWCIMEILMNCVLCNNFCFVRWLFIYLIFYVSDGLLIAKEGCRFAVIETFICFSICNQYNVLNLLKVIHQL